MWPLRLGLVVCGGTVYLARVCVGWAGDGLEVCELTVYLNSIDTVAWLRAQVRFCSASSLQKLSLNLSLKLK